MKYPVYEHFYAFQGEGCHMGRAAYFIRLYGCPLKCPWCDSAGTWHKDWVPPSIPKYSEIELCDLVQKNNRCGFIVLTGGEPAIFDLKPFVNQIKEASNLDVHIETSGAFPIKGDVNWVTVSPKWSKKPLPENTKRADEIKIIVENENTIDLWLNEISIESHSTVWLHPEWSQRNNPVVLNSISNFVKANGEKFRAGYQLHKLYSVDNLDPNSKPVIPLGGVL